MGACCGSDTIRFVYSKYAAVAKHKPTFEAMAFSELDIGRLYKIYRRIDVDNSGVIDLAELLAYLDLDRTRFSKRVFQIMDEDGSGKIDFREFVCSLWNYASLGRANLVLFAFDLYDKDSSGSISNSEVKEMLMDIYGKTFKNSAHARSVEAQLDAMEGAMGIIDVETFREFSRKHPALLFPAYNMQENIQAKVLGTEFWRYYSEKRIELCEGRYVAIGEFLEVHMNKKLYTAVTTNSAAFGNDKKIKVKALEVIATSGSHSRRNKAMTVFQALASGLPVPIESSSSSVAPAEPSEQQQHSVSTTSKDNSQQKQFKQQQQQQQQQLDVSGGSSTNPDLSGGSGSSINNSYNNNNNNNNNNSKRNAASNEATVPVQRTAKEQEFDKVCAMCPSTYVHLHRRSKQATTNLTSSISIAYTILLLY